MERRNNNIDTAFEALSTFDFEREGILLPIKKSLVRAFKEHLSSGSVHLVSAVCPDYSCSVNYGRTVYDFSSLGEGIGLNGNVVLDKAALLSRVLLSVGVNVKYTILMADVEAYDEEILDALGLSTDEFLVKLQNSKKAVAERAVELMEPGVAVEVGMMSEFLKEEDKIRADATFELVKETTIEGTAFSRRSLYLRLYGDKTKSGTETQGVFIRDRARADIKRYFEFGFAARRNKVVILEATAPSIAGLYDFSDGFVREKGLPALNPVPLIMIKNEY